MESFENQRSVQQGEDWNLDILLSASDREYIPFIISSDRKNPHFTVTVASTKFEKNLRYVKTWWSSVDDKLKIPRFYQTVPEYFGEINDIDGSKIVDLGEITSAGVNANIGKDGEYISQNNFVYKKGTAELTYSVSGVGQKTVTETSENSKVYTYTRKSDETDEYGNKPIYYVYVDYNVLETVTSTKGWENWNEIKYGFLPTIPARNNINATYGDGPDTRYLYYYTLASDEIDPELGHKPYYYFYYDYEQQEIDGELKWVLVKREDSYECRFIQNFLSKDTAEWGSQNYMYQITLVSGYLMYNVLNEIYDDKVNAGFDLSDYPKNKDGTWQSTADTVQSLIAARYNYIKTRWPNEFQPDIDEDSPLGYIEIPEPILRPTKLEVFNNLRTLI